MSPLTAAAYTIAKVGAGAAIATAALMLLLEGGGIVAIPEVLIHAFVAVGAAAAIVGAAAQRRWPLLALAALVLASAIGMGVTSL